MSEAPVWIEDKRSIGGGVTVYYIEPAYDPNVTPYVRADALAAAQARVAELEVALDADGGPWRYWNRKAVEKADECIQLRARVAELEIAKVDAYRRGAAHLCGEAEKQLSHLWAENERLREALEYGKDLIEGEAVGAEWKQKCLLFIRKATAALGKGEA